MDEIIVKIGNHLEEILDKDDIDFEKDGALAHAMCFECLGVWGDAAGFEKFQEKNK